MALFEMKDVDKKYYEERLKGFLPSKIIDVHTHVWLDSFRIVDANAPLRAVTWPSLVAKDNSIEDLMETYRLMLPDTEVIPVIFGKVSMDFDVEANNRYIEDCSKKYQFPALAVTRPEWSAEKFEEVIEQGGFLGCKVYLNFAPAYVPGKEIRIFDFLPPHHLEVLNRRGWIVMLHIPRDLRFRDPVNQAQLLEIDRRYPNARVIVAHVGRAYCNEDIGNAFEVLAEAKGLIYDITANTNQYVFERLIEAVGPKRVMFGSDMPILRMRMRRICEDGRYVNLVPKGLYGDVSGDKNMREVDEEEGSKLSFFMYEELDAFRLAAANTGLSRQDVEDIFYNNAAKLFGVKR